MSTFDLPLEAPVARIDPDSGYTMHGRRFDDPYAWMERLDDTETRAWIAAQEAVTRAVLDAVPGRDRLREAVTRATRHARLSPPIPAGPPGHEFLWQADADDEKLAFLLRRGEDAPLETVLDPNTWASDEALVFAVPSPDGALVAFGKSVGSTHDAVIHVLDVETGRLLPDRPRGTNHMSVAWRPDSSGFFYTACPEPGEVPPGDEAHWNAVYEHRLGSDAPARRVFGDDHDKEYWCSVKVTECGRFAVLYKWDYVHANVVHLLRLADDALLPVAPDMRSVNQVQVIGDSVLVQTNLDAPRGRLCVASLSAPTEWRTLIPENSDTLQTVTGVGGRLYAVYSRAASHRVQIHAEDGTHLRELVLPALGSVSRNEGDGTISGIGGSWSGDEVWVSFMSYVQPPSVYRYDYANDRLSPYHVPDIGLDASEYVTDQVWYESSDGTPVSMFVVHHKDLPRDGRRPVRLNGYGGFNIPLEPRFAALNAAWLELGGVLAFANVRGGGEYGRAWHEAACKTRRQNAFDDYVAAARWLVSAGYTTPSKLVSRGNSNGGLLVATTAVQAPDAFGAVYCRAAVLDMMRFPTFSHLSSATVEYGSPDDPVEGPYLAGYSPYHNVRADGRYPVMMFASAMNDRMAPPYDPLKMVARLQAEAKLGGPYLLLPLHASGHGGGTTLTALIEHDVDELAFYCRALGVTPHSPDEAPGTAS
ncbi:prolyl oligopeptidase [Streptosporangium becharense]|uniref:prolyl oligopeptidase n=1 Tax=Streptosporangium becharense TaxID=1816182 RepID=A0A7W9IK47_9ACTN|nr:prolyl oligopeptidase family serine peptidase [Streptosporangium becharense]MBB2911027.1 prolyl oligopeptidase [Streptosporangium becharense]MBB5821915.1 prolyl oligopeptidase [Streptosporangium becharense]